MFEAQMADEIMNGTWFSVRDSTVKSQTRRGSRPGDNLADMLFNFAFKQLIGAAQMELEALRALSFRFPGMAVRD